VSALKENRFINTLKLPLKIFFYVYPLIFLLGLLFQRLFPIYGILSIFMGLLSFMLFAESLLFGFFGFKVLFMMGRAPTLTEQSRVEKKVLSTPLPFLSFTFLLAFIYF